MPVRTGSLSFQLLYNYVSLGTYQESEEQPFTSTYAVAVEVFSYSDKASSTQKGVCTVVRCKVCVKCVVFVAVACLEWQISYCNEIQVMFMTVETHRPIPVSYTHLDVYKRQPQYIPLIH